MKLTSADEDFIIYDQNTQPCSDEEPILTEGELSVDDALSDFVADVECYLDDLSLLDPSDPKWPKFHELLTKTWSESTSIQRTPSPSTPTPLVSVPLS